jgi:hypothetical protein
MSISIQAHGFSGISVPSGGTGITIKTANVTVNLNGLLIEGSSIGRHGISVSNGSILTVQNCVIRNLTGQGINFVPTTGTSSLSVSHTYVGNNGGYGILVQPSGSASATAIFDYVQAQYNGPNAYGIALDGSLTSGALNGTATDTVSSNNGGGFLVQGQANNTSTQNSLMVVRSVAANNHTGVQGDFGNPFTAIAFISQTTITNNVLGCNGLTNTFGDNTVARNGTNLCNVNPVQQQ